VKNELLIRISADIPGAVGHLDRAGFLPPRIVNFVLSIVRRNVAAAINEATAEVKYFLTNATNDPLARVLAIAFRRWTVEHSFRLAKQEAGLMHYEGRDYLGLIRHLVLALVVLAFVAQHTERLRGEKPPGYCRTGLSGAEPPLRRDFPAPSPRSRVATHERSHLLPPATKSTGDEVPQETAA
jgi:hypothetical protein